MTGRKIKSVWNYAKFVFWGARTNPPRAKEHYVPPPAKEYPYPGARFRNSSIADIIHTNIESRMRENEDSPMSNSDLLRRLKERQK
tara:strand:- start:102 stop:359 length:258 start_codon:yes stop_codon:yes gene_type:complete